MKNPVIYVLLNGELKMSPGKAAAQAVHATMLLDADSKGNFLSDYKRTVVVLEAKNSEQMKNLFTYLDDAEIDCDYYIDEGKNEVDAYSITALAAFVGDNEELRELFESFPLYGGHITVKQTDRFGFSNEKLTIPNYLEVESKFAFRALKKAVK